jgi:hypothetical protein
LITGVRAEPCCGLLADSKCLVRIESAWQEAVADTHWIERMVSQLVALLGYGIISGGKVQAGGTSAATHSSLRRLRSRL